MPEQLSDVQIVASESLSQLLAVQTSIPEDEDTQPLNSLMQLRGFSRLGSWLTRNSPLARSLARALSLGPRRPRLLTLSGRPLGTFLGATHAACESESRSRNPVSRGPGRAFKLLANRRGAHVLRSVRAKARPATPSSCGKNYRRRRAPECETGVRPQLACARLRG